MHTHLNTQGEGNMFGKRRTSKSSEEDWIDLKCWNAEFRVVLAKFLQYSNFKTGIISELRSLLNRARIHWRCSYVVSPVTSAQRTMTIFHATYITTKGVTLRPT